MQLSKTTNIPTGVVALDVVHILNWVLPIFYSLLCIKRRVKSFILLLKCDATVLALPSIDRQ